jgi:hypothetical protein
VSVQVIDQRRSPDAKPVETREKTGPDGRRQVEVIIADVIAGMAKDGRIERVMAPYALSRRTNAR